MKIVRFDFYKLFEIKSPLKTMQIKTPNATTPRTRYAILPNLVIRQSLALSFTNNERVFNTKTGELNITNPNNTYVRAFGYRA